MGVSLGAVTRNIWDSRRTGRILGWFVQSDYCGVKSVRLIQSLIQELKRSKVSYISASCDYNTTAEKAYRKLGFQPLETTLHLEV